jgi:hypothetical protein
VAFRPSKNVQQRVAELVERSKDGSISAEDQSAARAHHDHGEGAGAATHRAWAVTYVPTPGNCLLHEDASYSPHQIDHIISRKHGGRSDADNLAYACLRCNAWKGSDVGSLDSESGRFVNLFHPRRQRWEDHFVLRGAIIEPHIAEAKATVRLLKLNLDKCAVERRLLATTLH